MLALLGAVIPFLRWFLWTYTLTNKRIVEQKGILTRTGRVIPLSRINDVAFEKNLNDRILGCGTLVIHDASEQAGLELRDIPHIEAITAPSPAWSTRRTGRVMNRSESRKRSSGTSSPA